MLVKYLFAAVVNALVCAVCAIAGRTIPVDLQNLLIGAALLGAAVGAVACDLGTFKKIRSSKRKW